MIEIQKYITEDGRCPIDTWLKGMRDTRARARVLIRLDRIRLGLFGDHKPIAGGVEELRISEGKGYRVYFGRTGNEVVLLLCGGNKASQPKDIRQALKYWKQFNEAK